jgi:hypothetical protein
VVSKWIGTLEMVSEFAEGTTGHAATPACIQEEVAHDPDEPELKLVVCQTAWRRSHRPFESILHKILRVDSIAR